MKASASRTTSYCRGACGAVIEGDASWKRQAGWRPVEEVRLGAESAPKNPSPTAWLCSACVSAWLAPRVRRG